MRPNALVQWCQLPPRAWWEKHHQSMVTTKLFKNSTLQTQPLITVTENLPITTCVTMMSILHARVWCDAVSVFIWTVRRKLELHYTVVTLIYLKTQNPCLKKPTSVIWLQIYNLNRTTAIFRILTELIIIVVTIINTIILIIRIIIRFY